MLWHNLGNSGTLLSKRNCPFQNDLLKNWNLKISIDFSSRKKKNISYSRIPNLEAPEPIIDELLWISLKI